ncbi:MAG: glycosyltransferase family 2 protein [Syntrophobacteraceae bacterium]
MSYEVIVPVYNGENVIEACLKSIVEQNNAIIGNDYSVLVIDDGSTDRTVEIAGKFPVKIISLAQNRGRLIARLTGATHAGAERILFVDSRVTIPSSLMASLPQFDHYPAAIGQAVINRESKESWVQRIFFLIRRKYYGPKNFPTQEGDLLINAENFKRAPKGTGLLLIDRNLFIKLNPERTERGVSDDTLLFYNLVFKEGIELLRPAGLRAEYNPSRRFGPLIKWLYERGTMFADFYLSKGGYFQALFRMTLGLALLLCVLILFLPVQLSLIIIWMLLSCYLFLCIFLSEEILDFFILLFGFPVLLLPFSAGILKFTIKGLYQKLLKACE